MAIKTYPVLANFLIDLLVDAVCVVGTGGRFVFVSAACERIFGYTPDEMIGKPMIDFVYPGDRARTLGAVDRIVAGHLQQHFENRYVRKDGQLVHIMWSARWSEADQLRIAVARDVTERKQAEAMQSALYAISEAAHVAEDLLALYASIHQIIGDLLPAPNFAVAMRDASGALHYPYQSGEDGAAHKPHSTDEDLFCAEVLRNGQSLLLHADLISAGNENRELQCWLGVPLNAQQGTIGALVLKSFRGGASYTEKDKELLQFVATQVATAIERKQMHARLHWLAHYDELTGLPNRGVLHDRLSTALARARRARDRLSVLYLDLDKFKQINDTFGHAAGDQLLREVARRVRQCVRDSDTVARMGGDEFVVLLENIQLPAHAEMVAGKIRTAFAAPIDVDGYPLYIAPSIGIAHWPEHGDEPDQLLRQADAAMYQAKKQRDECLQAAAGQDQASSSKKVKSAA